MRGLSKTRFSLLLAAALLAATCASAAQVVSTPKNVNAVMQARGFYLAPSRYAYSGYSPSGRDLAPVQSFEIIRPRGERVTIGRLFTSCTCVQVEASKRTFEQGEPAILNLHNIMPTPPAGQNYAIYVQLTSPIRTTLRIDTFVQSSQFVSQAPITIEEITPEAVADEAETAEKTEETESPAAASDAGEKADGDAAEAAEVAETAEVAEAEAAADAVAAEATEAALKVREAEESGDVDAGENKAE